LYTGQENDSETGLDYYNARYYDPHIRRFIQPDDVVQDIYNPQALNVYSYALNNPLRYTDPTGHVSILDYNNSLNQYYKSPSATTYNNVLTTISTIQKSTKSTSSSGSSGGSNNNQGGGGNNTQSSNGGSKVAGASANNQNQVSVLGSNSLSTSSPPSHSREDTSFVMNSGGVCGSANAGIAAFGTVSGCIVGTHDREVGWTISVGGGGTTGVATGIGVGPTISTAKNIAELKGQDVFGGWSAEAFGIDASIDRNNPAIKTVSGGISGGPDITLLGVPIPFEAHGGSSYTMGGAWFKY
jgi:RHS repeat-associated protein